jgi:hypothetical protein
MNSDVRDARRLVEDESVPNSKVLEERRRDELVDRHAGVYGLNTNPRPPSLGSQIEVSEGLHFGTMGDGT